MNKEILKIHGFVALFLATSLGSIIMYVKMSIDGYFMFALFTIYLWFVTMLFLGFCINDCFTKLNKEKRKLKKEVKSNA